jgi:SAM-dependent methyltransferase
VSIDPRLLIASALVAGLAGGFAIRAQLDVPQDRPAKAPPASASAVRLPEPAPVPAASNDAAMQAAFDEIYEHALWGTNGGDAGTSGFGSMMKATSVYRTFLAQFMKDADIHSVVDAGCGDWESTQAIDWAGIDYKGYDIVASVIEKDKKQFGKPHIQFFTANIVDADLPPADLIIVKQVLQHLPNAAVAKFLEQLPKYKHALIMDSVEPKTLSGDNRDIAPGQFRALDLTRPPFNLLAAKVLTYWDGGNMQQMLHIAHR